VSEERKSRKQRIVAVAMAAKIAEYNLTTCTFMNEVNNRTIKHH
jgi:hypothetical protein